MSGCERLTVRTHVLNGLIAIFSQFDLFSHFTHSLIRMYQGGGYVGKAVVAMCFFMMYLLFIQYFPHDVKYGMAQKFSLFWNAISRTCSDLAYS